MPNLFAMFRLAPRAQDASGADESRHLHPDDFAGEDEPLLLTDFVEPEPAAAADRR